MVLIMYESEKIQAAEMRVLRNMKGYTRQYWIKNEDIRNELGVFELNKRIR